MVGIFCTILLRGIIWAKKFLCRLSDHLSESALANLQESAEGWICVYNTFSITQCFIYVVFRAIICRNLG